MKTVKIKAWAIVWSNNSLMNLTLSSSLAIYGTKKPAKQFSHKIDCEYEEKITKVIPITLSYQVKSNKRK